MAALEHRIVLLLRPLLPRSLHVVLQASSRNTDGRKRALPRITFLREEVYALLASKVFASVWVVELQAVVS